MGPLTAVRPPAPAVTAPPHPPLAPPGPTTASHPAQVPPADALGRQPLPPVAQRPVPESALALLAAPRPAEAAAEDARRAYIRASLDAGINPLPLPGT